MRSNTSAQSKTVADIQRQERSSVNSAEKRPERKVCLRVHGPETPEYPATHRHCDEAVEPGSELVFGYGQAACDRKDQNIVSGND